MLHSFATKGAYSSIRGFVRHFRESGRSPYYRFNLRETFLYAYAKWLYAHGRVDAPEHLLEALGIDLGVAFRGYARWEPLLDSMFLKVRSATGQQGGISMEDGRLLYGIVRALQPEYVIETGVAAGVSNAFLSAALLENGHGRLFSIELQPSQCKAKTHQDGFVFAWPELGVGWAVPPEIRSEIGKRNELILGDVKEVLPALLRQLPRVDVFFHDDLHTPEHMKWEYDLVWPYLAPGGVLVSDDANYGWLRFCREKELSRFRIINLQRLTAARKAEGCDRLGLLDSEMDLKRANVCPASASH